MALQNFKWVAQHEADGIEVEFSGDQENDRADPCDANEAA
jgi:hypothetical protein